MTETEGGEIEPDGLSFVIRGEPPSKKNSRVNTRSGRSFPSKRYMEWHDGNLLPLCSEARRHGLRHPLSCPVRLTLLFRHGDRRRRDSDNQLSSVLDLLVDAGILADDRWTAVYDVIVMNRYNPRLEPGVIIRIDRLTEDFGI